MSWKVYGNDQIEAPTTENLKVLFVNYIFNKNGSERLLPTNPIMEFEVGIQYKMEKFLKRTSYHQEIQIFILWIESYYVDIWKLDNINFYFS